MTLSKDQYKNFMKLIYKVLLPLYREDEMNVEIEQEWMQDSAGHDELTFHLFSKLLFRVAHAWATHIDINEYIELLEKIYYRITIRKVIKASNGESVIAHPTLQVIISPPETEGPDPFVSSETEADAIWEPCLSDEDEDRKDFEYHYFENKDNLTVKKHKKRKPLLEKEDNHNTFDHIPMFPSKEPIKYEEEVVYHQNNGDYRPQGNDYVFYVLAELKDVFPLGYATE